MSTDLKIFSILFIFGLLVVAIFYPLARFSYFLKDDQLIMEWRIFKFLHVSTFRLKLKDISEVRRSTPSDLFSWSLPFGNMFAMRQGITFDLKRFVYASNPLFTKRVIITPDDPDVLLQKIRARISDKAMS